MSGDLAIDVANALIACGLTKSTRTDIAGRLNESGHFVMSETAGSLLVVGVPGLSLETQNQWLGIRVGIWPRIAFERRRTAVVSSRLSRRLSAEISWFDAFRTLVCQLDPTRDVLITADGTTADRFLKRAAWLFGLNLFSVNATSRSAEELAATFDGVVDTNTIGLSEPVVAADDQQLKAPASDRMLVAIAHHIRALAVRNRSTTYGLLKRRLDDHQFPAGTIRVAKDAQAADALAAAGAILWILIAGEPGGEAQPSTSTVPTSLLSEAPFDEYLLHWTRSPDGPWPDEQEEEYLDNMILGVEASNRTAFASLCRIIQTNQLLATSHLIRGQHEVVCFSEVPLATLPSRRTFRSHLHRWDYEPYGIGIRKSRLMELGARPVVYGSSDGFETLSADEQPFFQLSSTADQRMQWTDEAEWRTLGGVDLAELAGDVFVFVPSEDEARAVRECCDWPVVLLPASSD